MKKRRVKSKCFFGPPAVRSSRRESDRTFTKVVFLVTPRRDLRDQTRCRSPPRRGASARPGGGGGVSTGRRRAPRGCGTAAGQANRRGRTPLACSRISRMPFGGRRCRRRARSTGTARRTRPRTRRGPRATKPSTTSTPRTPRGGTRRRSRLLLCATRVADGARGALRASDQAVMARVGRRTRLVPARLGRGWCIHTAQHTDTSASRGHAALSRGHVVTMARVEELADLALDLLERDAAAAPQSDDHPHWWSRAEASALFPRALPATDWDVGNGLSGLSAVEACAALAGALAAGGTAGRSDDGDGDGGFGRGGDSDGFSAARDESASAEYPRLTDDRDDRDSRRKAMGWPVSDIAAALRTVLDEPAEDGVGAGTKRGRRMVRPPTRRPRRRRRVWRVWRFPTRPLRPLRPLRTPRTPTRAPIRAPRAGEQETREQQRRGRRTRSVAAASPGAGAAASRLPPTGGPLSPAEAARSGGAGTRWPRSAARRDASRRVRVGRHAMRAAGRGRARVGRREPRGCGGGGGGARSRRRLERRARRPFGRGSSRKARRTKARPSAFDGESQDGAWDVPGFIAPMADALVGEHDWSPLETAALLEHLQAWTAEDAAALVGFIKLGGRARGGAAPSLTMEWRRDPHPPEVAHVVRARSSPDRPAGASHKAGARWGAARRARARLARGGHLAERAERCATTSRIACSSGRASREAHLHQLLPAARRPAGRGASRGRRRGRLCCSVLASDQRCAGTLPRRADNRLRSRGTPNAPRSRRKGA